MQPHSRVRVHVEARVSTLLCSKKSKRISLRENTRNNNCLGLHCKHVDTHKITLTHTHVRVRFHFVMLLKV